MGEISGDVNFQDRSLRKQGMCSWIIIGKKEKKGPKIVFDQVVLKLNVLI